MPFRLLVFAFLLATSPAFAQQPAPPKKNKNIGVFNITQIGHSRGIGESTFGSNIHFQNRGHVNRLRTTFGYFVRPEFSVGLGFGLDRYNNPGYNTAPLVTDFRYYLRPDANSLFAVANAGYLLGLGPEFATGSVAGLGVGYRLIAGRRTHLLASIGLEAHQIQDARLILVSPASIEVIENNIWLKSVSFNMGLLF